MLGKDAIHLEQDTLSLVSVLAVRATNDRGHLCLPDFEKPAGDTMKPAPSFLLSQVNIVLFLNLQPNRWQKGKTSHCAEVCGPVLCSQSSKLVTKMEKQHTFRLISNPVSLLKPPLLHLVRFSLPPDSSTGYSPLRFLHHIIFMWYVSTSHQTGTP